MTIREATPADVDGVLLLIRASPELPQWSKTDLAVNQAPTEAGLKRRLLVAEEQGRLVGFAQTALVLGEAELESMAVALEHRGQRIGSSLLSRGLTLARSDGATVLRLEVRASNHAARHLYERAELSVTGRRRAYYREPVEDAVLMEVRWQADAPGE